MRPIFRSTCYLAALLSGGAVLDGGQVLAEGRTVVVHCHGGRSRTGLVLKAWAMRANSWSERDAHEWLAQRWHRYEDYQSSFISLLREDWL